MKNILSLVVCWLFFVPLAAQNSSQATVILKNGSQFVGEIINYTPKETLVLQIENGTQISFDDQSIKRIIQEGSANPKSFTKKPYFFEKQEFYNETNVFLGFGRDGWSGDITGNVGIQHVFGKQFNHWLGTGVGVAWDSYYFDPPQSVLPVFAEARGYFLPKNFSPMYKLAVGYGFAIKDKDYNNIKSTGGLLLYPALGFRIGVGENVGITFDLGYKFQKATYYYAYDYWEGDTNYSYKMNFKRLNFRFGVVF
ncbi:MAG: hypothetical protein R2798_01505 [Chitinophagales bacterium]|nr:hypothetical protein [Bacteroidota bacterium]MCB9042884.1 hypothetical protein [Chitinophagales bacterium]